MTALSVALLGVLLVAPSTASATPGPTLWVNNTTSAIAGYGTSCARPGFTTVQSAVNAAAPLATATLLLCPGSYAEQVQITGTTELTIRAAVPSLGATLTMPATITNSTTPCDTATDNPAFEVYGPIQPDQDGFAVCGTHATTVTVQGITFDEDWPAGTCYDSEYGILVGGGDTLRLKNSAVVAGGAVPINGCQGGIGVQAGMAWTLPVERGHLFMTNDTVSGYQKNGVTVDGAGSTASISYDTIEGAGPTTQTAQNGIQVSNGAYATISHSTISRNECNVASCGSNAQSDYQAGGVLFYGAKHGSSVRSCLITHNDYGVYFYSENATLSPSTENSVLFSTISANRDEGVLLDQGRELVASDHVEGGRVGIMALQYTGQAYGVHATIDSSILSGSRVAAVEVLSDLAAHGDLAGTLTFDSTAIHGSVRSNATNYSITFTH